MVHTEKMTDAEINRAIAEMEGVCIHANGYPNYLSDGNYILGLIEKLLKENFGLFVSYDRPVPGETEFVVGKMGWINGERFFGWKEIWGKDEYFNRAVALAAIRKDGEK